MTAIQNFIQWATAQDELLMNGTRMVIVEKAEEFAKLEQRENGAVEHILKQIVNKANEIRDEKQTISKNSLKQKSLEIILFMFQQYT